jgi:hypothetical protein
MGNDGIPGQPSDPTSTPGENVGSGTSDTGGTTEAKDNTSRQQIEQEGETNPPNPPPGIGGDNPSGLVTSRAEDKGAVLASDALPREKRTQLDRDGNDDEGGSLPNDPAKRRDAISRIGYKRGLNVRFNKDDSAPPYGRKPQAWSDDEYDIAKIGYDRGVEQARTNKMSPEDRLIRVEKALGLPIPREDDDDESET